MGIYDNDAAEGSLEWHAWGEGHDYSARTNGVYENPLSGEWANMIGESEAVYLAWLHLAIGDTYTEFLNDRETGIISDDEWDDALDAFETGYLAWRYENGKLA